MRFAAATLALLTIISSHASPARALEIECDSCDAGQVSALRQAAGDYLRFYRPFFSIDFEALPLPIRITRDASESSITETGRIVVSVPDDIPAWVIEGILFHELTHWMFDRDGRNPFSELMFLQKRDVELDREDTRWWNQGNGEKNDGPHRGPIRELRLKNEKRGLGISLCKDASTLRDFIFQYSMLDELLADLLPSVYRGDLDWEKKVSAVVSPGRESARSFTVAIPNTEANLDRIYEIYGGYAPHALLSPTRSIVGERLSPFLGSPRRAAATTALARDLQAHFFSRLSGCRIETPIELNQLLQDRLRATR